MSDRPPAVAFDTPSDPFRALLAQRHRLRGVAEDVRRVMQDVGRFEAEGAHHANMAAVWAATLMVADILKIGLSAGDRRANVLFKAQDRAIEQANTVLKHLGLRTITTRGELLKTVDPNRRGAVNFVQHVREAQQFLKRHQAKAPKEIDLLLKIGIAMTEDSVLILQAGQTGQQVHAGAAAARASMLNNLSRVSQRILLIDQEITRMVDLAVRHQRTA